MKNIYRVMKNLDNPYVRVNKTFIEDDQLSFKAKGILLYLLSRPDDWNMIVEDLVNRSTDGKSSVSSGIDELKKAGYLKKVAMRNEKGQVMMWSTKVFEHPQLNEKINV